jgi:hypothetical protein
MDFTRFDVFCEKTDCRNKSLFPSNAETSVARISRPYVYE